MFINAPKKVNFKVIFETITPSIYAASTAIKDAECIMTMTRWRVFSLILLCLAHLLVGVNTLDDNIYELGHDIFVRSYAMKTNCGNNITLTSKLYSKMPDVAETLPYADKDGGVWKQGWDVKYPPNQWTKSNPLEVIVVR